MFNMFKNKNLLLICLGVERTDKNVAIFMFKK